MGDDAPEQQQPAPSAAAVDGAETLEAMQARHRRELRELQGRITSKKRNATKKTRKGVNEECAELERRMREGHGEQVAALQGGGGGEEKDENEEEEEEGESKGDAGADVDGAAEKLAEAKIGGGGGGGGGGSGSGGGGGAGEQPRQPQPQQGAISAGGGGKKRNRQKERLARRAAEQEEEAARAEAEAAGMTDHRGREREALSRQFAARGLVERDIAPDGHCLFAAAADQLGQLGIDLVSGARSSSSPSPSSSSAPAAPASASGSGAVAASKQEEEDGTPLPPPYRRVRHRATDYMRRHADDFAPFLDEELGAYLAKMRDTAEWGGQLELAALASAYAVDVVVLQDGRAETIEPQQQQQEGSGGEERERIHLAYYRHGYGLGEHYNSLRKAAA